MDCTGVRLICVSLGVFELFHFVPRHASACERCFSGDNADMKLIVAIIQPSRLEAVKEALAAIEVSRLTVLDCQGFGRQKGQQSDYEGPAYAVNLLRKVELQIAVNDDFVEPTIAAIAKSAKSGEAGQVGDGKIFVIPLEDCIRIRTGERGREAI